jgi:hypothetical protein
MHASSRSRWHFARFASTTTLFFFTLTGMRAVSAAAQTGLVAAYGFNETSGSTTVDASGNDNTGTLGSGVTRTTGGKFGGALTFNGTSGRVTVANAPSLQLATAMTLEAWVLPTTVNNAWRDVVYKGNDNYYLMGTSDRTSRPGGGGIIGGGSSTTAAFGTTALTANTWTHIAVTYDGANVRFYVNGAQVSSVAKTGLIATSTNPLTIGGDPIYGQYFKGTIDEVRVYNRALTAAELQTDMNTPVGGSAPDTQNPTVAITAPSGTGSYTTTSSPIALAGTASDNVGVTQVSWTNDRGGSGVAGGTTSWNVASVALQPGANVVTVSASDAAGNVATTTLTVTYDAVDNTAPTIRITSPTSAGSYTTNQTTLTVAGTASDNVGVTQVSWTNSAGGGGTASGTSSWSAGGIALQPGTNIITVTARDAANNPSTATLSVTQDGVAPAVTLTAPAAGSTVSGASVTLTASASDNSALAGVQFLLDGSTPIGAEVAGTGPNFSTAWSTIGLTNGAHTLTARARDAAGNTALSAGVSVTVSNAQGSGLVAAYGFEETSGNTVTDVSSFANNGTVGSGVTRSAAGKFGRGLAFDGSGLVRIPNASSLVLTNGMTLEAWVNPAFVVNEWHDLIYKGNDNYFLMVSTTQNATPVGGGIIGGGSSTTGAFAPSPLPANTWTHVATTFDGGTLRLFVNGTEVATAAKTGSLAASTNPLTLGGDEIYGQFFTGALDEVRVYNRALSAAEIQNDMVTPIGTGAPVDVTAPTVAITTPVNSGTYTTTTTPLAIGGTASDNVGVTQVTWTNDRGGSGTATGTTNWTVSGIALLPGTNVVTVTARDAANNAGIATLSVTYTVPDNTAPTVGIVTPTTDPTFATRNATVALGGNSSDDVGVTQVSWVNDRGGSGTATGTTSWSVGAVALQPGANVLTVTARDAAGNTGTAVLTVTSDVTVPTVAITTPTSSGSYTTTTTPLQVGGTASDNIGVTQVTWTNDRGGSGTAAGTTDWTVGAIALQPGANLVTVTARDAVGNAATSTLAVNYSVPDNTAPTISITTPSSTGSYTTNQSSLTVAGSAADNVAVTQVSWANDRGGSGAAAGTTTWTASGIPLQPGSNVITATARDSAGNPASATLTVTQDAVVPSVTLTAPAAGATVSGANVTLTATASDNLGLSGLQFLLDGTTAIGSEIVGGGPNYTTTWNTVGVSNGTHTLSARATDAAGNTAVSADVSVTVSNAVTGLVAAYGFEEASGSSVVDASTSLNNGTLGSGVSRTATGKFGRALTFNGTSGMVTVPNAASLALSSAMTLEAWVNPSLVVNEWRDVVYKGNDNYYLMVSTNNGSRPAGGGLLGGAATEVFGVSALPINTWTHVATTFDGTALRLYVNGALVATVTKSGSLATSSNPLTLGGDPIYGQFFAGSLDEVRVYNRALSLAEIQSDMVTPVGGGAPGDATAPVVAITTPTSSGSYSTAASPLAIGGTASDNVGVTQVAWSNDRGGSGTATGTTTWSVGGIVLQPGTNVVTVTARDAANNAGTATLNVTYTAPDVTAPTINITTPTNASTYTTSVASLAIGGNAADNVGVTQVTWTNDRGGSGTASGTTSWSVSGIALQPGPNVITITARDAASNPATATLTVTQDAIVPAITLTAPASGATVSGSSTTLTASATDNNAMAGVQFLLDGTTPIGAEVAGPGPTYTMTWNTLGVPNGSHTLSARARDAAGNIALSAGVPVTVSNSRAAGLVAAYGFEESSDATVLDASGNDNNGSFGTGVARTVKGKAGAALLFLGNGMVTIPNSASLQLTNGMTLEAWVKPSMTSGTWADIVYKGNDNYFLMGSSTNGSRPAGGGIIGGGGTTSAFGDAALPVDAWSHIAATYDGAALRFFVNGTQVSTIAKTGNIATSTNPLSIGGDPLFGQNFAGTIDEVRVYNRPLTVAEITNDMTTPVTDPAPATVPSIVGQWSDPFSWPLVGIHTALLKTGEVLTWEYDGAGGPFLWNPITGEFTSVPQGTNKFCAGQAALPDGRLFIAGGHSGSHVGIPDVNIFDPSTRSWTAGPSMATGRWYPTVTALADGRALIMSGEINCDGCNQLIPEVYNPLTNQLTRLTAASQNFTYYPHTFVLPDGRVLVGGSAEAPVVTKALDLNTLTWTTIDPSPVDGGSSVMYLPGKIMKSGTSHNPDLPPDPSAATTYVLDMTQPSPHWVPTAPMAYPRTYHNLTVLPDGNVLVTGGGITTDPIGSGGAVYAAELWSPDTQKWTTLSSGSVPRLYHSTALLLPDGRVLVAGMGRFNGFPASGPLERLDAELFSPPYLFKGARPVITSAPDNATYGATISVQTPDASTIASATLIKLSAVTHAFNQEQRFVPLSFTPSANGLDIQIPANANLAPPGYYMLFIVNGAGVPSIAPIIQIK